MVLAADLFGSYRRADVCRVLNGLNSQVAYAVGLWDLDNPPPICYHAVCDQILRLERALGTTWIGADDIVRDLAWFCHALIAATIPDEYREMITTIAIDSTIIAAWARTQLYDLEKDLLAAHRLKALENIDLDEPELPKVTGPFTNKIGELNAVGRFIRSLDFDAMPGWKTATNREKARIMLGFDIHLAVPVSPPIWIGNPNRVAFGEAPPQFIMAMMVAPGSTNPGPIGLKLVEQAMLISSWINRVLADRGYTNKRKTFCRELHKQGIDVVMDYNPKEIERPIPIEAGNGQQLFIHCGVIISPWVTDERQVPRPDATGEALTKWHVNRSLWRWTVQNYLDNGGMQLLCPQCAGRVQTSAETYNPQKPASKRRGPRIPIEDDKCCGGLISLLVEWLDSYQRIPYGTPAWKKVYGQRNNIENKNSMLKDKSSLELGWCRAFGLVANTIGVLARAIVHNLRETLRAEEAKRQANTTHQSEQADTPCQPDHSNNGTRQSQPARVGISQPEEQPNPGLSSRAPP